MAIGFCTRVEKERERERERERDEDYRLLFPPDVWLRTLAPCAPLPFPPLFVLLALFLMPLPPLVVSGSPEATALARTSAGVNGAGVATLACSRMFLTRQHFLYFFPEPHGQAAFGFTFVDGMDEILYR